MKYVIQRTDQGGGYVAPSGSQNAYTPQLQSARLYSSREAAEHDSCPGNERILSLEEAAGAR